MTSSRIFLSFLLLLISSASAFNITRMLDQYPDFSNFNSLLSQTHLASEINSRQTITVLAVDNSAVSGISGSPADVQKHVLSVHVILDYYDVEKLKKSSKKSTLLTTLFQSSGLATNQQGFINVTIDKSSGEISMGSSAPGSSLDAKVVKQVTSKPYNISVLQVSSLIHPTGIDNLNATKAPAKAPIASPKAAPTPAATPSDAPSLSPASDGPAADGPATEAPSTAPASDAPVSDAPVYSEAPVSDAPVADAPSDAPAADGPSADGPDAADPSADAPAGESEADGPNAEGPAADQSSTTATRVVLVTCLGLIVGVVCMAFL